MAKVGKPCEVCGKLYFDRPSVLVNRRYCSRICSAVRHGDTIRGEKNPTFKHGCTVGRKSTLEFATWQRMLDRCENENGKNWDRYGGRGIKVCERWHVFQNFLDDMGTRPSNEYSIEREDNDGDYCPENCVWATRLVQANNRACTTSKTYKGETRTLPKWAKHLGISLPTLRARLSSGWTLEEAFETPASGRRTQNGGA